MFELLLIACTASRACEYITVPTHYESVAVCERQAAIVAGMVRGRHNYANPTLEYEASCSPVRISALAPYATSEE